MTHEVQQTARASCPTKTVDPSCLEQELGGRGRGPAIRTWGWSRSRGLGSRYATPCLRPDLRRDRWCRWYIDCLLPIDSRYRHIPNHRPWRKRWCSHNRAGTPLWQKGPRLGSRWACSHDSARWGWSHAIEHSLESRPLCTINGVSPARGVGRSLVNRHRRYWCSSPRRDILHTPGGSQGT